MPRSLYASLFVVFALGMLAGCSKRRSDEEIASQIKAAFYSDIELKTSGISVAVKDGEVTLTGGVPSADLQLRAFKLTYHTAGVNAIRDDIRVVPRAGVETAAAAPITGKSVEKLPGVGSRAKALPPLPEERAADLPQPNLLPDPPPGLLASRQAEPEPSRQENDRPVAASPQTPVSGASSLLPGAEFAAVTTSLPTRSIRRPTPRVVIRASVIPGPSSIFQDWFTGFHHGRPDIAVNYETAANGTGIRQLTEGAIDLAVTSDSLTKEQTARFVEKPMQIPVLVYAVVPVYNLPGVTGTINFTAAALGGIFQGAVVRWNHPLLTAANPNVPLPDRYILLVPRSDSPNADTLWSTYLSSTYLSKVKPDSQSTGARKPSMGASARGDRGVVDFIRQHPYTIGYADLAVALDGQVSRGAVQNAKGRFVAATESTLAAAALSPSELTQDGRISIVNTSGQDAYPISGFEWFVYPGRQSDPTRDAVTELVDWVMTKRKGKLGQPGYAALPEAFASALWQRMQMR